MVLRLWQIDRFAPLGDEANKAFAPCHMRLVHRFRIQTLGCEQFHRSVTPADIDRAHLGDHDGRDLNHDLGELGLAAFRKSHDLTEATQQNAW